ncbi:DUF4169 family protein [Wenxinia saemankumensis]|uniref:DUF4169 domain-containing protein n=1 Tax=Wenxinia saemankumensis TaxID=1447782 RepID=A0A1M6AUS6_9RHOB|nr:DUF4169 family protein [Wenxinia saemankumensis]SHI40299.1 protein of unknown function [Wenxinia saemankumensis]
MGPTLQKGDDMADAPINLNKARKARARAEDRARADANAARFGRTRSQKARDEEDAAKAVARLEAHRRDPDAP